MQASVFLPEIQYFKCLCVEAVALSFSHIQSQLTINDYIQLPVGLVWGLVQVNPLHYTVIEMSRDQHTVTST